MEQQIHPSHRIVQCDIETDDVPDGGCRAMLATNASSYIGYGQIESDSGTFLSNPSFLSRGCTPYAQAATHVVSPYRSCESNQDSGLDSMRHPKFPTHRRSSVKCDSLDNIDLNKLRINSLTEDTQLCASPIQLIEHKYDSAGYSQGSGSLGYGSMNKTSINNSSLNNTKDTFTSCESGYYSHKSYRSTGVSIHEHPCDLITECQEDEEEVLKSDVSIGGIGSCSPEELFIQNEEGDTLAHYAIYTENQELFNSIIVKVTHLKWLNIHNNQLQTALHLAVIQNQPHNVRRLISWGASIDVRDRHGNTPLHLACDRLQIECVIALTTHLGRRDVKEVPYTVPFQRIPQDQDLLNYAGKSCLHLAAEKASSVTSELRQADKKNYITIVHHLLSKCSANINVKEGKAGETVLHQAVQVNHPKLAEYLLQSRHIDINMKRYDGKTPYQLAVSLGSLTLQQLLLRHGAYDSIEVDYDDDDEEEMETESDERRHSSPKPVFQSQDADFGYDDIKIGGQLLNT